MATGYRREATSHGVRNNRNPTQAPGAARRVGESTPPAIARGARHLKQSASNQIIYG